MASRTRQFVGRGGRPLLLAMFTKQMLALVNWESEYEPATHFGSERNSTGMESVFCFTWNWKIWNLKIRLQFCSKTEFYFFRWKWKLIPCDKTHSLYKLLRRVISFVCIVKSEDGIALHYVISFLSLQEWVQTIPWVMSWLIMT